MAIRKGKSDNADIDDLMQDINQENQLSLEENHLEEKIAALKEATAALNAAADRADIIIKGLNKAIDAIPTMSIGARVNPDSLKAISDTCNKFALDVDRKLIAHRNKQLEQQKAHEQRIARMMQSHEAQITHMLKSYEEDIARVLSGRQGIWLSNRWTKILFIFLAVYTLIILFYVKFG